MPSMLSNNFSLEEFTFSQTAVRNGVDNDPTPDIVSKLVALAHCMERVRVICGSRPIRISSGFRAPRLNALVGGSKNSAHTRGEACDFTVAGLTPRQAVELIAKSDLKFDQLILEGVSAAKPNGAWVHVGISDSMRQELLTMKVVNGRQIYERGSPNA